MPFVKTQLCSGCGVCAEECPRGAITILYGRAHIEQARCDSCGLCVAVCPFGAMADTSAPSTEELDGTVADLKRRTQDLLDRIAVLRR